MFKGQKFVFLVEINSFNSSQNLFEFFFCLDNPGISPTTFCAKMSLDIFEKGYYENSNHFFYFHQNEGLGKVIKYEVCFKL